MTKEKQTGGGRHGRDGGVRHQSTRPKMTKEKQTGEGRYMRTREVRLPTTRQLATELKREKYSSRYKEILRSTVYFLIIIAAVAVLIATLVMPVVQITGTSMEPTLMDGDIVVLKKTDRFKCGNLCAFYYQNRVLLKRVVGNPGDYIEIDSLGNVKVNGEELVEPYVSEKSLGECDLKFPYQVPEDKFFVLGDHRRTSIDSRSSTIGCVETEQIIGRVLFRIWPLNKITLLNNSSGRR